MPPFHTTKSILIHMIFCPKYRRPLFQFGELRGEIEQHIRHIATLKHIQIAELAVMPDHVHLMAYLPPDMSVSKAAFFLKWFSSIHFRKRHPEALNPKALWARNYWCTSVGGGEAKQRAYIANQMQSLRIT